MKGADDVHEAVSYARPMSRFCVYTIRQSADLDAAYERGGRGRFSENTRWKTGQQLFQAAERHREAMAVIFAAAEWIDRLLYHALLEDIAFDEADSGVVTTMYRFTGLTRIEQHLPLSTLTLRSTGRALSDSYIRPYTICFTPDFLLRSGRKQ